MARHMQLMTLLECRKFCLLMTVVVTALTVWRVAQFSLVSWQGLVPLIYPVTLFLVMHFFPQAHPYTSLLTCLGTLIMTTLLVWSSDMTFTLLETASRQALAQVSPVPTRPCLLVCPHLSHCGQWISVQCSSFLVLNAVP